jgi:hypothetical protein
MNYGSKCQLIHKKIHVEFKFINNNNNDNDN